MISYDGASFLVVHTHDYTSATHLFNEYTHARHPSQHLTTVRTSAVLTHHACTLALCAVCSNAPALFVSGAIHPPRGTPAMWRTWMKEAVHNGLNMVQVRGYHIVSGTMWFDACLR